MQLKQVHEAHQAELLRHQTEMGELAEHRARLLKETEEHKKENDLLR